MPKKKKPRICAVRGCPGDRDLTKTNARLTLLPGERPLSFFRVPAIISRYNPRYCGKKGTGENLERVIALSTIRRNAWLKAIGKENELPDKCMKVCAQHFVSGHPAELEDETNIDWVPTLKLVPVHNPLVKAKFLIKKLVQRQKDTSFRLKYGLSSEDEPNELKEKTIEPIEPYADTSGSPILSETEGVEEVLIQEIAKDKSRVEKIKEIFIPGEPKIQSRVKRKSEVLIQEEPNNESRAKIIKGNLVREQPTNESIANEIEEIFIPGEPKSEPISKEHAPSVEPSIETIDTRLEKGEILLDDEATNSNNTETVPSAESSIAKIETRLKQGEIFLDNEATNSNITKYMLQHSDGGNGHWHLRFCKIGKCMPKEENDCEITDDVQAQPCEQKGHYHLRLCTSKCCVLSESVDKMYSLKGT